MKRLFIVSVALLLTLKTFAAATDKNRIAPKFAPVVVAVIDTGADIHHKDLKEFIWTNPGESGLDKFGNNKETNKLDDDGNGFADDIHGWNFVDNNNDVSDDVGHGTHISGIIKREFNRHTGGELPNSTFVPSVRLMILKYYDPHGKNQNNLNNSTRAIQYANKMKVKVINYSGGGGESNQAESVALHKSLQENILVVAAAGNNFSNTDVKKYYPANYALKNIISVAATNRSGELMPFSNYGRLSVDIAAPGKWILSTLPHNKYGVMSGTSQATAFVTGVVAKLIALNNRNTAGVYPQLLSVATFKKGLQGKTKNQLAIISNSN